MPRALLRLTAAYGTPPLRADTPGGSTLAPYGRWLRERVASLVLQWPAVGFHRVDITPTGLDILLIAGPHADARAQFVAVLRAVERDTSRAALRCGWSRGAIWCDVMILT